MGINWAAPGERLGVQYLVQGYFDIHTRGNGVWLLDKCCNHRAMPPHKVIHKACYTPIEKSGMWLKLWYYPPISLFQIHVPSNAACEDFLKLGTKISFRRPLSSFIGCIILRIISKTMRKTDFVAVVLVMTVVVVSIQGTLSILSQQNLFFLLQFHLWLLLLGQARDLNCLLESDFDSTKTPRDHESWLLFWR